MSTWPRNLELLRFSPKDSWTLDEACLGTLITGATGSGKTTGPFQYVVRSFLRAGFGGLFLCAKIQSFDDCMQLVRAEGREQDVVVFDLPESQEAPAPLCFNFLTYEAQRYSQGRVIIENVANLLSHASEIARPSANDDKFFDNAKTQLLLHCLEVTIAATGKVDFGVILEMVQTLPQNLNQVEEGRLRSLELLDEAERKSGGARAKDLDMARRYFTWEWPTMADRTRSSIAITLSVFLHRFLSFPLRELFTGELTISPDHILKGGIVIVKLNIPDHETVSKFAGVIWKYAVQKAIERRPELAKEPIEKVRPIFIAVDEAQFWATKSDQLFQTTARSTRGLTVYATQNISNFHAEMAADSAGRARVDSMMGNLQNRFFCQNLQQEMNLWASESIGKVLVRRINAGTGVSVSHNVPAGGSTSYNQGWAEQLDYDVQPRVFDGLLRGGNKKKASRNGKPDQKKEGQVEAIVVIAGQRFAANDERWLRVLFDQFNDPPLWLASINAKPWACIVSGDTPDTWFSSFRHSGSLTPMGLWRAIWRWELARRAEKRES